MRPRKASLRGLALLALVLLGSYGCAGGSVNAKGDQLFVIHSRDHPSSFWVGIDVTIEETQRDGRVSIFIIHRNDGRGATGRFFMCTMITQAKKRGYVNISNAKPIDGRSVVIFLKEHDEDIQALIESGYREYEFFERVGADVFAMLEQRCAAAGML